MKNNQTFLMPGNLPLLYQVRVSEESVEGGWEWGEFVGASGYCQVGEISPPNHVSSNAVRLMMEVGRNFASFQKQEMKSEPHRESSRQNPGQGSRFIISPAELSFSPGTELNRTGKAKGLTAGESAKVKSHYFHRWGEQIRFTLKLCIYLERNPATIRKMK